MTDASASPNKTNARPSHGFLILLLVGVNLIWGASWVVSKVALESAAPVQLAGWRMITAALVVAPVFWLAIKRREITLKAIPLLAGLGLIGYVLNKGLMYWGINLSTATNASLIMATEPGLTVFLAWWILREPLTSRRMGGLTLGMGGAYLLIARGFQWPDFSASGVVGDLMFFGGLMLEACYSIWGKITVRRLSPVLLTTGVVVTAGGFWLPIVIADGVVNGWPQLNLNFLLAVAYLSIGCTILNYAAWFYILNHMDASKAGMSLLIQPLLGVGLAATVLGEHINTATWVGGGMIVCSLLLTLTTPSRTR